jgi:hypothetical protein
MIEKFVAKPAKPSLLPHKWGVWRLQSCGTKLRNGRVDYRIRLDTIKTRNDILWWIFHCSTKSRYFYGETNLDDLVYAFRSIYGTGPNYGMCSPLCEVMSGEFNEFIDGERIAREYAARTALALEWHPLAPVV